MVWLGNLLNFQILIVATEKGKKSKGQKEKSFGSFSLTWLLKLGEIIMSKKRKNGKKSVQMEEIRKLWQLNTWLS